MERLEITSLRYLDEKVICWSPRPVSLSTILPPIKPINFEHKITARNLALFALGVITISVPFTGTYAAGLELVNPKVVAGNVTLPTVDANTTRTTININSQRAIVEWDKFNLNSTDNRVLFKFNSAERGLLLNRILDSNYSNIIGGLRTENGMAILINPNGFYIRSAGSSDGYQVNNEALAFSRMDFDAKKFFEQGILVAAGGTKEIDPTKFVTPLKGINWTKGNTAWRFIDAAGNVMPVDYAFVFGGERSGEIHPFGKENFPTHSNHTNKKKALDSLFNGNIDWANPSKEEKPEITGPVIPVETSKNEDQQNTKIPEVPETPEITPPHEPETSSKETENLPPEVPEVPVIITPIEPEEPKAPEAPVSQPEQPKVEEIPVEVPKTLEEPPVVVTPSEEKISHEPVSPFVEDPPTVPPVLKNPKTEPTEEKPPVVETPSSPVKPAEPPPAQKPEQPQTALEQPQQETRPLPPIKQPAAQDTTVIVIGKPTNTTTIKPELDPNVAPVVNPDLPLPASTKPLRVIGDTVYLKEKNEITIGQDSEGLITYNIRAGATNVPITVIANGKEVSETSKVKFVDIVAAVNSQASSSEAATTAEGKVVIGNQAQLRQAVTAANERVEKAKAARAKAQAITAKRQTKTTIPATNELKQQLAREISDSITKYTVSTISPVSVAPSDAIPEVIYELRQKARMKARQNASNRDNKNDMQSGETGSLVIDFSSDKPQVAQVNHQNSTYFADNAPIQIINNYATDYTQHIAYTTKKAKKAKQVASKTTKPAKIVTVASVK